MFTLKKPVLSINKLLLISAVYFTFIFNFPFLSGFLRAILDLPNIDYGFFFSVPVLLICLLSLLLSFIGIKYLIKPLLITITLASSLVFYGAVTYGVVFDYGMIENSFETDTAEAFSYLNTNLIISFVLTGVIPATLIALTQLNVKPWHKEIFARAKMMLISFTGVVIIASLFYQDYASVGRNNSYLKKHLNPSQFLSSGFKYIKRNYIDDPVTFVTLDKSPRDMRPDTKEVVVLMVGETARAANFSANGYAKPTNSATQPHSMISFKQMFSCGTATAVSVPCMFSSLTRENFDRRQADHQQNLLDLLSLANVDVLWVDNNGCKDVCNRVETLTIDRDSDNPLCDGEYCQDEILLQPLNDKLAQLSSNKTVIVLHMLGSHGPTYYKRYPEKHRRFTPDCPRSDIQNCTQQQLVNTYDNTIAYTDHVISEAIKSLQKLPDDYRKTLIYLSDHGESLGESGVYLHGFPYSLSPIEQRHIPMMMWVPERQNRHACLSQIADQKQLSHDNFFHSVLGLMSVSSTAYQPNLDIFSTCSDSHLADSTQLASTGNPSDDL